MRWSCLVGLVSVLVTSLAYGADYQKGKAALERGEDEAAAAEFRPLAEAGNADAQFALGWMYESVRLGGRGIPETMKWYRLAADQGHSGAQYSLGRIYQQGFGREVPQDFSLAMLWYQKAAAQGNTDALFNLGQMYRRGQGVKADPNRTLELWKRAAELGDGDAADVLGDVYRHDKNAVTLPMPVNYPEAIRYYRMAAQNGRPDALRTVAGLYQRGEGVPKSEVEADRLFHEAAAKGDAVAQYELGTRYRSGVGVAKDLSRARQYFAAASEQGYRDAQRALGLMYFLGEGVQQDMPMAVNYLRKAANQGEPHAALIMGQWSLDGMFGVQRDLWAAANYFGHASNGGLAEGSTALAQIKAKNNDPYGAITFYLKAKQQGNPAALRSIEALLPNLPKYQVSAPALAVRAGLKSDQIAYTAQKGEWAYLTWEPDFDGWVAYYFPSSAVLGWLPQKSGFTAASTTSAPFNVSSAATTSRTIRYSDTCHNGDCIRTFEDGRKERFQAPYCFDAMSQQWTWKPNGC